MLLEPARTVDVVAGAVNLDFDLARFGVLLVTLAPVGAIDASVEDAPGMDARVGVADAAGVSGGTSLSSSARVVWAWGPSG